MIYGIIYATQKQEITMADEYDDTIEEFDPNEWLNDIMGPDEIDSYEDAADNAEVEDKKQHIAAKLEREIEELRKENAKEKAERSKEKFENKVRKYLEGIGDNDPRKEFLYILKGAKMDTFDDAVATVEKFGQVAAQKLGLERQQSEDAEDALAPPVHADVEDVRKPDEAELLWKKSSKGDTRATLRLLLEHPKGY
jgi:hypothetical protein